MNNYEFCAGFAQDLAAGRQIKVLDYGCGAGETVGLMRAAGLEAFGCETFYEGGDASASVPPDLADRIVRMDGGVIPFDDATFKLVVTNQVIEHVVDIDVVLSEIGRVLEPGGACLAIFPHLETWREGHVGMPFLHLLPKGAMRLYYCAALRAVGLGTWEDRRPSIEWARIECQWIDDWCHYRPLATLREAFARNLSCPEHLEAEWLAKRVPRSAALPAWLRTIIARKMAGVVMLARKNGTIAPKP